MDKSDWVIVLGAQCSSCPSRTFYQKLIMTDIRADTPNTRVCQDDPASTSTAYTLGTQWFIPSYVDKGITSEMTRVSIASAYHYLYFRVLHLEGGVTTADHKSGDGAFYVVEKLSWNTCTIRQLEQFTPASVTWSSFYYHRGAEGRNFIMS
ncbi:hypothetical protein BDQ17DRAFT_1336128 [Cyathus striatus]|nr:hypothetical protein BDQ17DRAFT_1336128 [Cyathus striatus]